MNWIPVKDRLPPIDVSVLVYSEEEGLFTGYSYETNSSSPQFTAFSSTGPKVLHKVTHWAFIDVPLDVLKKIEETKPLEIANNAIEKPELFIGEWYPLSEVLPEEGEEVFTTNINKKATYQIKQRTYYMGKFWDKRMHADVKLSHWMQLPKAPKNK